MPVMRVATGPFEPVVLYAHPVAGRLLGRMRHRVEHILDTRALPGLSVPVAMDEVSPL
jgi:hypothetical protein